MKNVLLNLTLLIAGAMPLSVFAQSCPPGQYPVAGQGWNYCAPVPGAEQEQAPTPQQTGPQWKNVWQSTAVDNGTGTLGTATGRRSAKDAERGALEDCKDKGGVDCKVQVSMVNGCIAMVVGDKLFNVTGGATEAQAVSEATATCKAKNNTCRVYYSHCDYPIRIQ